MSKSEILEELPRLNAEERNQVFERLCELQEADLLRGAGPSENEKRILDEALAEFEADRDPGVPWREALQQILSENKS
jgi:hypothetical protein